MGYKAKHDVHHNGKGYAPGEPIPFGAGDDLAIEQLIEAGAIEGEDDRLANKTVAALVKIAGDEGVELPTKAAKAVIVQLIEAKRAEVAGEQE